MRHRRMQHDLCVHSVGVFLLLLEYTWERDGRYGQLLTKRGNDTHGELTNTACYESLPREPRGSDSAWGPARWPRSRGRNGVA